MQLRSLPLLWRDATEVQVGTDPRWAVALTDLSPSATRALTGLDSGCTEKAVCAALAEESVSERETAALLAHLHAARLLVNPPRPRDGAHADVRTWALLTADGDGQAVLTRRAHACVRLSGLGRTGAVLAATLVSAGVGHLELDDDTAVSRDEVGFGGLTSGDVGTSRAAAVARAAHDICPRIRTTAPIARHPDIVVLISRGVADPARHRPLNEADVPHLAVVLGEASVQVGPLVIPGRTACLTCLDLYRSDLDPRWPVIATQLASDELTQTRVEETVLAAAGATQAAAQVLAHLDGRGCATHDATLEIALPLSLPEARTWPPHSRCVCGSHVHT